MKLEQGQHLFWPLHCEGVEPRREQPRLHLGFGQFPGFLQVHEHLGAEQVGRHLGTEGVQTVWHLAGKHTFSHTGHPPAAQFLREQRTSHLGFSHRISQAVGGSRAHRSSQVGFSHWGSH